MITKIKIPKSLVVFFLITVVIYSGVLVYFLHLESKYGDLDGNTAFPIPVYDGDSWEYATLASNLIEYGSFTLKPDSVPSRPEIFRTIGYPLFLVPIIFIGRNWLVVSFVQMFIVSIAGYLIYRMGAKMGLGKLAYLPSLFFILDPTVIFNTILVGNDILFTFLVLLAIYITFFIDNLSLPQKTILAGLVLGFATLIRPIGMFLPLIIIPFFLYKHRNGKNVRNVIKSLLLLILFFCLMVVPWMLRNKSVSGIFAISTITSYNLFYYNVPYFLSWKFNMSYEESVNKLEEQVPVKGDINVMHAVAVSYIKQYPFSYGIFHLTKTTQFLFASSIKYFLMSGIKAVAKDLNFTEKPPNLSDLILKGDFASLAGQLKSQLIFTIERLMWIIVVVSAIYALFSGQKYSILLCLALILYFLILTGPVSYVRYRLPAEPFMFLAGTCGIKLLSMRFEYKYYGELKK